MKKVIAGALALSLCTAVVSCKKETQTQSSVSTDTLATVLPKDSGAAPKTDSVSSAPSAPAGIESITKNDGKYPHEVKLFEDKAFTDRLKKILGKEYDGMVTAFSVESPIVSENGIYKLHGCKQHDCPGYATSIYYDSKNDNLNVSIDKNGKISDFTENGKIPVSESLKSK
ncbi:hypothetical protein H3Z85_12735 [Chryseobacterium indologenes]|uniref:hypothetical protein n=1 Tax=Chryseobacterium indologenes TaxID=253 RepID=UPI0003E07CEA|nr:hypothetical protein [Chryseobacterium indologenes]QPQ50370.1 hypothetical protein H3Z85_12735 [Chryseobacterium indologenes]SFK46867.1 hypothetical protein SAMN05421692_4471 [Chryseobacterium indologenes]SUX53001.1 Uncharacterised protein [Chryseobacterium indologenes]VFA43814.1 Uncharacterised protein [Chryseobacterium indologenes]GAE66488.1 hypothetical protein CIN01S_16_00690 [Chryseobacterium indologenes NBRC 14944]